MKAGEGNPQAREEGKLSLLSTECSSSPAGIPGMWDWNSVGKSMGHTPYKAMLGRAPPSKDGAATESIPMDGWVQELRVAQEEARKLISANIKSEQQD